MQMVEFFGLGMDYDLKVPDLLAQVTRDDVRVGALHEHRVAGVRILRGGKKNTWLEIVLDEGRNRHIRRASKKVRSSAG